MNQNPTAIARPSGSVLSTNKVIRNTYMLLSMTLLASGVAAYVGVAMNISHGMALVADIAAIALLWFVLPRTANSAAGIPVIFAFTGLLGFGLGPVLRFLWGYLPTRSPHVKILVF
jgi:modulator of FtsH protease